MVKYLDTRNQEWCGIISTFFIPYVEMFYAIRKQGCITNSKREICHTPKTPKTPTLKNIYDLRKESYIFLSLTNIYLYVTLYSVKTSTNYLALNPSHLYHYIMLVCCVDIILRGVCMNIRLHTLETQVFQSNYMMYYIITQNQDKCRGGMLVETYAILP